MNSVQDTDYDLRKKMYEEIKTFNRTELEELYKLLRRNSEEISENRNGMFFDLLSIKSDTLNKIKVLLIFVKKTEQILKSEKKNLPIL